MNNKYDMYKDEYTIDEFIEGKKARCKAIVDKNDITCLNLNELKQRLTWTREQWIQFFKDRFSDRIVIDEENNIIKKRER